MTTGKDVQKILGNGREVVEVLAEIVERNLAGAASKTNPSPSPSKPPSVATRKPSPPVKPKAKTSTSPKTKGAPPMRQTKAKPKPKGIEIREIDDPAPRQDIFDKYRRPYIAPPKRETSASDVDGVTPCRICGGAVEPGGRTFGPWRQHKACASLAARAWTRVSPAAEALGLREVSDSIATHVDYLVQVFSAVHLEPTYGPKERASKPWKHPDKKALKASIEKATTELEESLIPGPCAEGLCAWCGVSESLAWFNHGHKRVDGSPAPLCASCSRVYQHRGRPSAAYWDDQRGTISEAITGVPPQLGERYPEGLIGAAEATQEGDGTPWSHLSSAAVESFKWSQWGRFGGKYAPIEHREEAMRRSREGDQAKARATAEKNRVPDAYGFGDQE